MAQPRRRLGAVAGIAVLAVLAAACGGHGSSAVAPTSSISAPPATSSAGTGPAGSAAPSGVRWSACKRGDGPRGYQCATVMVPRNPSHPDATTIAMAIDRHAATGPKIGSLLVNPGGPGVSGVDALPGLVSEMPKSVTARFDVVGFDPPGVGRTAPITCLDSSGLEAYFHVDPEPLTPAGFNAMVASDKSFGAGCEAQSGAEVPYVSTVDAAEDMDVLRSALGDSKLTYLGYSYGTFLGETYAELFPTRVRAMVLDGALDPALPALSELGEQSVSLEAQLEQFFSNCTSHSSCAWKPVGTPTAAYEALLAKVQTRPLPVHGSSRTVGPSELLFGTAVTLYSTGTWKDLATALQDASTGDGSDMLQLFDDYTGRQPNGTYTNLFEANAAINCLDAPAPTLAQIQAAVPAAEAAAPIFGLQGLYGEVGCTVWPVPATGRIGPIHATGSPPILVVGSTGDPVTPYSWAQALASQLTNGVLLTRVGDGHTAYAYSSCIRTQVDNYLVDLKVPPAGVRCSTS